MKKNLKTITAKMPCNFINEPLIQRCIKSHPTHTNSTFILWAHKYIFIEKQIYRKQNLLFSEQHDLHMPSKIINQKTSKQGLCYTKAFFTNFACVFVRKCEFGGLFYRCKGIWYFRGTHVYKSVKHNEIMLEVSNNIFFLFYIHGRDEIEREQ